MTGLPSPHTFVARWGPGGPAHALNERQGAQAHFIELCALLGVEAPTGGDDYLFEKGTLAFGQQRGFADVFKRGCFAWEYKAPGRPLDAGLNQLMRYALALDNPPLLVVSDRLRIEVHTHFNGTPSECHVVRLDELTDPAKRELLRRAFEDPESFKPKRTNRQITEEAAEAFATTAERLRTAGHAAETVSRFLTQCLFCFFAEDVGLLPQRLFERLVGQRAADPEALRRALDTLFTTMRDGGLFGADSIAWFNGGLFQRIEVPALDPLAVAALRNAAALDWSAIDPSIFGTLFERGLDPAKRGQLGAHYTDPATIMRIVEPVVQRPLLEEWERTKQRIEPLLGKRDRLRADAERVADKTKFARMRTSANEAEREAQAAYQAFLERLHEFRVLDPASGSGNFLYLALKALKDIEHRVNLEAEALGLHRQVDAYTSPANVLGIEINEYAAELARVTVWIGELQWRLLNGYPFKVTPILDPLDQIECRDALIDADGNEAEWPKASVVIGNPPFVGDKKMRAELGAAYTDRLRATFATRVSGGADLVCYWFEKARAQIESQGLGAAGLVATNSIRGGRNRMVLDRLCDTTRIFAAWSDQPWVNEGAAVRVSLLAFGRSSQAPQLDGLAVESIAADLTGGAADQGLHITDAVPLAENADASYLGIQKTGPFEIAGARAREWLALPNPHARPNSDVLRPWFNGLDATRRNRDMWIVDFGADMDRQRASLYEAPFAHLSTHVRPTRVGKREARTNECWWLFQWARPLMRKALAPLARCIATPEVAKHRVFIWLPTSVVADKNLSVVARADDTSFGVLHSRFHELWSLRMCTWMGKGNDPRYTPTTCFETFPFPAGLAPADTVHQRTEALADGASIPADLPPGVRPHAEAIARAAKALNDLRERWLNPPEWTDRVPEVIPLGMDSSPYPDRIVAKPGFEAQLAKRTLTNLYNERPAWLAQAHEALDAAVAAAYGWTDWTASMPDDELLRRLLALNQERAAVTVAI